ncbi:YitT family protein [Metamycoplasma hyosynoviae]|nr:YitT family protein [Metamycoplasma hyosynoviae]MDC8913579.1 YitT family protein [Metamycoplasma hyosynoviae]
MQEQKDDEKPKRCKKHKQILTQEINLNPYNVNFFTIWKKFPKKMFFIFLSAMLYNIGVAIFLGKAATVASGLSALVQGLTYSVSKTAPYFAYIYFGINLPFVIAFWLKNPRTFMLFTLYWLLFQVVFQSIMLIKPIYLTFDKISIFYINWKSGISWRQLQPWSVYSTLEGNQTWPVIIYTLIGGVCAGVSSGLAWKNSGSTAGSDIIVYYISRMKKKSIGSVSTFVALAFATFSISLIFFLEYFNVSADKPWNPAMFLLRAVSTIIYIFIYNGFLEILYPKYKKVKIEIYSKKAAEIIDHLKSINYWHGYNYESLTSGYSKEQVIKIETIALFLEQNQIKNEILSIDDKAFITIAPLYKLIGNFNTSKVE